MGASNIIFLITFWDLTLSWHYLSLQNKSLSAKLLFIMRETWVAFGLLYWLQKELLDVKKCLKMARKEHQLDAIWGNGSIYVVLQTCSMLNQFVHITHTPHFDHIVFAIPSFIYPVNWKVALYLLVLTLWNSMLACRLKTCRFASFPKIKPLTSFLLYRSSSTWFAGIDRSCLQEIYL